MTKKYIVKQDGINDCGSVCLLSIIRYYGGDISLTKLLDLTKTDREGTNFYYLLLAAKEIGLTGRAYKVDNLDEISDDWMPFISQVTIHNYKHFVVVYKIHKGVITVMDPAKGMVTLSLDEFKEIWTGYILVLEPYKRLPVYRENNFILDSIKEVCIKNFPFIINIISYTIITIIFTCIYAYYFKMIIDLYDMTSRLNMLTITIIFIFILFIKCITMYLRNNLLMFLNQKIDLTIIATTIKKVIKLPYSYYKQKRTGDVISRISDLMYVKNVVSRLITTILLDMLLALFVVIILFFINEKMTLLLFLIVIIYLLVFTVYRKKAELVTNSIQERSAMTNSLLTETIYSYASVKGLNLEDTFIHKINDSYLDLTNNNLTLNKISNTSNFIKDLFEGIFIIIIIYLGITLVMDNKLSLGSLLTYYTLLFYFINPIRNLIDFYNEYYYVKNSIRRINNLMDYKFDELEEVNNLPFSSDIHIRNLSFSYDNKHDILKNINLDIRQGEKVMLLGNSGSGKTTLLKLLYRYYDVGRNKIFIGKYDLLDYKLSMIRRNIVYLSQDEFLYTDTIKNNIILDRDVTDSEFLEVCNLTETSDIVKDNPIGYEMPLEENGINISGGQRQRIILARMLLKKAKIILIDEGLNEMDVNLERRILNKMFISYPDSTIIVISHRTDNISLFDKAILFSDGSVRKVVSRDV